MGEVMINNINVFGNTVSYKSLEKKAAENKTVTDVFSKINIDSSSTNIVEKHGSSDSIMDMYKSICEKYPDVTFRLDDMSACTKYYDKNGQDAYPYMGYNGSMNQVGENFGEMYQKSVEIDCAVLERCMKDLDYKSDFEFYLDNKISRYDVFRQEALQAGYTNICVGFSDENGKLSMSVTQAHCAFATEEEMKHQWAMLHNTDALVDKVDETKDEVLENYMQMLSEHSQKIKEQLESKSRDFKDNSDWREMSDEEWKKLIDRVDVVYESKHIDS